MNLYAALLACARTSARRVSTAVDERLARGALTDNSSLYQSVLASSKSDVVFGCPSPCVHEIALTSWRLPARYDAEEKRSTLSTWEHGK